MPALKKLSGHGRIRTHDLQFRKLPLYPTELRDHTICPFFKRGFYFTIFGLDLKKEPEVSSTHCIKPFLSSFDNKGLGRHIVSFADLKLPEGAFREVSHKGSLKNWQGF